MGGASCVHAQFPENFYLITFWHDIWRQLLSKMLLKFHSFSPQNLLTSPTSKREGKEMQWNYVYTYN